MQTRSVRAVAQRRIADPGVAPLDVTAGLWREWDWLKSCVLAGFSQNNRRN